MRTNGKISIWIPSQEANHWMNEFSRVSIEIHRSAV